MNTKIKSIAFTLSPKKDGEQEFFPLSSIFELNFREGISDLYYGDISFYAANTLSTSELHCLIEKQLCITLKITDTLAPSGIENEYDFTRTINGIVRSVRFLGKTQNVICTNSNKAAYIYRIEFVSPLEVLKRREYKYRDDTYGKLQKKLETFLSKPNKVTFGSDYEYEGNLPVKFELLDNEAGTAFSSLPDNVCIQVGSYSPLQALKKILTDSGLNFNIQHGSKDGSFIKIYLSRGYGVSKSCGIESSYFKEEDETKYNYDIPVVCDESDSSTPKLTSFSMEVVDSKEELFNNENDFLLYGMKADSNAVDSRAQYQTAASTNILNKAQRERTCFRLKASHLIFVPGCIITAKNYLDREIKLIVDDARLCVHCPPDGSFKSAEDSAPSIEASFVAYEMTSGGAPGSFAFFSEEDRIGRKEDNSSAASNATVGSSDAAYAERNEIQVFEAIVCNGDGKFSGVWDSVSQEPLPGSICICAGDNTDHPSTFYAIIKGQSVPVVVYLTSTVASHEIFNMPRIGQNILIIYGNNKYYLHSFLAQHNSNQVDGSKRTERDNELASINAMASYTHGARVHVWNDSDQTKNVGLKGFKVSESTENLFTRMHLDKNSSTLELVRKQILSGTESTIVEAMVIQNNTYAYYEAYEGNKEVNDTYYQGKSKDDYKELKQKSIKKRCAAVAEKYNSTQADEKSTRQKYDALDSQIKHKESLKSSLNTYKDSLTDKKEQKKVKDRISSIEEEIKELKKQRTDVKKDLDKYAKDLKNYDEELEIVTNEFNGEIGLPDDYMDTASDVFKLDHKGNVEINVPNGTLTINAKNIVLAGASSVSVNSTGAVTVTSSKSVQLGSAGTSLSIIPTSMKVISIPYANGALSGFGSTFTVDSLQGTSIKTPKFSVNAKFEASISDSFGGNLKISKGVNALTGVEVSLLTLTKAAYIAKLVQFDTELANEFIIKLPTALTSPSGYKYAKGITEGVLFPAVFQTFGYFTGPFKRFKQQVSDFGEKRENGQANGQTVARLIVNICDFIGFTLDEVGMLIDISTQIAKLADDDNWLERTGVIGRNHSEDIKFALTSAKYMANGVAAHALCVATGFGESRGEFQIKGGEIFLKALKSSDLTINKTDNNSAALALTGAAENTKDAVEGAKDSTDQIKNIIEEDDDIVVKNNDSVIDDEE